MFGPETRHLHDININRQSVMGNSWQETMSIGGRKYYLYRDTPYILRCWIHVRFNLN